MGNESLYRRSSGTQTFSPSEEAKRCMDERMSAVYCNGMYTADELRKIALKADLTPENERPKAHISPESLPEPLNTFIDGLSLICEASVIMYGRICEIQDTIEENARILLRLNKKSSQ